MEKGGPPMDFPPTEPPPPYNYNPPVNVPVPQPMQPAYGPANMPPPVMGGQMPQPVYSTMQSSTVVSHTPQATAIVVAHHALSMFGSSPARIRCVRCNADVVTQIKPVPGLLTWLICGGLIFLGCVFFCCFIPFCVDDCQDIEHWCPNCKSHLGTYKRM